MKSTSKVIGAEELSEKARLQEERGNLNKIGELKENHSPLMELYKTYSEKLAPLIKVEDTNSDKPLIDEATLSEAYGAMKEVAQNFDYDSMIFIFQSLEDYRLPENEIERYKKIKDATDKFEWEKVNELLKF